MRACLPVRFCLSFLAAWCLSQGQIVNYFPAVGTNSGTNSPQRSLLRVLLRCGRLGQSVCLSVCLSVCVSVLPASVTCIAEPFKKQLRTNILENYATTLAPPGRRKPKSRREPNPNFNLAYSDYSRAIKKYKLFFNFTFCEQVRMPFW